jgi:hypothetical protein
MTSLRLALALVVVPFVVACGGGGGGTGGSGSSGEPGAGGGRSANPPDGGECLTCNQISAGSVDPRRACAGPAADAYKALFDCACNTTCASVCGDNVCQKGGSAATNQCEACFQDTESGCGKLIAACKAN